MKTIYRICYCVVVLSPAWLMWLFIWVGLDIIPDNHWSVIPFAVSSCFVWLCSVVVSGFFVSTLISIAADKLKGNTP